jgi:hypothetical protein
MSRLVSTLPPIEASPEMLAQARENCAARSRARGDEAVALAYEAGAGDVGWGFKHEVSKLKAEAAAQ